MRPLDVGDDKTHKTERNQLAELRKIMVPITKWLKEQQRFDCNNYTVSDVATMWQRVAHDFIKVPVTTAAERERRIAQLSWLWYRDTKKWMASDV